MDSFSRTEEVSWFSRIIESIKGVLIGLLLFLISFPLLFWNEGRAVERARNLAAGREAVVEASATAVDASQEGKLVHLTGPAAAVGEVADGELGPSAAGALRLRRVVEMFQWSERRETSTSSNTGGSQTRRTTYTYRTEWSSSPVDSSRFERPAGHFNPPMSFRSQSFDAPSVTVGARALTPELIQQVDNFSPLAVDLSSAVGLSRFGLPIHPHEQGFFLGTSPGAPSVGDYRVRWESAAAGPVSVLAAQRGNTFASWRSESGNTLEPNLEVGARTAAEMFSTLETNNALLTWVLRFVGWLFMFLGILSIVRPLVVVADVLPFAGSIVGAGASLVAFLVASPLSLLTVAIGWIFYRPVLGIGLTVVAVGIAVVAGKKIAEKGRAANAQRQAQRQGQPAAPQAAGFAAQLSGQAGPAQPMAGGWGAPPSPPQGPGGWGPPPGSQ